VHGYTADNIDLIGYHDLREMPAFKLALQVVDGRWYLYATRFWEPGIWMLDVTDPARPEIVGAIVATDDPLVATWQVQVADGLLLGSLEHRPPPWGGDPARATDEGIVLYDVRDPSSPVEVARHRFGASGTHRNFWAGGRYVHATAAVPGYGGNIYVVLDIGDPTTPREVGRWALPDQRYHGGERPPRRISLHGPAYPHGDRCYLPYGAAGAVILDISDVTAPRLVSRLDIGAAFASRIAMHTVIPLPERGLAVVNTEAIAELSAEPYNFAGIVDISDDTAPRLMSLLPPPVPHAGAPYPNFQTRGGRFGPHNQHHHQGDPHLFKSDQVVYLTWFNAGLRVYDIRDPWLPREIASFLPDDPQERRGLLPTTALVTQSEDVLVDARGYAYVTDKNHGLHIVRCTADLASP
jgi:hypothetical protein